jgi:5-methylcytosine-specific restriction endonuclease McrA
MKCKVTWCNNKPLQYKNGNPRSYCKNHIQYTKYASNASSRPWLMYKVEKILNNDLICEHCNLDMVKQYGEENFKSIITAMDVDHIDPSIKGTLKGEQPTNYQLLCKMCHVIKSHKEGDFKPKKYR